MGTEVQNGFPLQAKTPGNCLAMEKEIMKTALIRSLAMAMLAGSLSAFAAVAPPKDDPPATPCPPAATNSPSMEDHSQDTKKKMKKEKTKKMKKEQQK